MFQTKGVNAFYNRIADAQGADRSTGGSHETEDIFMSSCIQTPARTEALIGLPHGAPPLVSPVRAVFGVPSPGLTRVEFFHSSTTKLNPNHEQRTN